MPPPLPDFDLRGANFRGLCMRRIERLWTILWARQATAKG
jgi:hypothetical protein